MQDRILCVDDDDATLTAYRLMTQLRSPRPLQIETANSGEAGLSALQNSRPYAVVISDMKMPGMDGIAFLGHARSLAPETVRIMVTGHADLRVAIEAVNQDNVFRFLLKPFKLDALAAAITAGIAQYHLIRAEKDLLERTLTGVVEAFSEVLSLVSPTAFGRTMRVQRLVKQIGNILRVEKAWQLDIAALLSQLGCVIVPQNILRKESMGARLTPEELAVLEQHPRVGQSLIRHIPRLECIAQAIGYQRRRLDDRSDGVHPGDIPLEARILKVALDFDALETAGLTRARALERLRERNGWYDAEVIDALDRTVSKEAPWAVKEMALPDLLAASQYQTRRLKEFRSGPVVENGQVMVLAEDVLAEDNALLLSKGQELTSGLLERLRHYSHNVKIREPIRVLISPSKKT